MSSEVGERTRRPHRLAVEALAVGVVVIVAHLALRLSALFATGAYNDDGVYVVLGRSLAAGSGYRMIHLVGAPVAVKFPPGLPAILALAWKATGSLTGVRAVVGVIDPLAVGATAGLLWWLGRRRLGVGALPLAALAIGPLLLDPLIHYLNLALAEPEFLLGWAGALVLAFPLLPARGEAPPHAGVGRAVALGVVLAAATLFRSIGIVLLVVVLLVFALRRAWRPFWVTGLVALLPLMAWSVWHARLVAQGPLSTLPDEAGYWQLLPLHTPVRLVGLLAATAWQHTAVYARSVAAYLMTPVPLGLVLVAAFGAATLGGAVQDWRRRAVLSVSVLGMLAAVCAWPFAQERFVLVVLPFAGLLAAAGVQRAADRLPVRARQAAAVLLLCVVAAVGWRQRALRRAAGKAFAAATPPDPADFSPAWFLATNSRFIYEVSAWVRQHARPDDRLLVDSPSGVYLYTGRRTMQATPAQNELTPPIFSVPGRYLADHLLADSITLVVVGWPGGLATDAHTMEARCPDVLAPADGRPLDAPGFPRFLRVTSDSACIARLITGDGA